MRIYLALGLSLINVVVLAWWTTTQTVMQTVMQRGPGAIWVAMGAAGFAVAWLTMWLWRDLRRPRRGQLIWTGRHWGWHEVTAPDAPDDPDQVWPAASEVMTVQVVLDWQSGMLLEARHVPGLRWLWLDRELAPSRWLDLRRAVWGHCGERPQAV